MFYASLRFEPVLGVLSTSPLTAWLDGFFLNHAVVTASVVLEWQRTVGLGLIVVGLAGFALSAVQVYGNKLRKRGVTRGFLYRFVRHPEKAYKRTLALEEALNADVRLTPLVVVNVAPASGEVTSVKIPLPQNAWGPNVVMPIF